MQKPPEDILDSEELDDLDDEEESGGCPITASINWFKKIFEKIPGFGPSQNAS